MVKVWDLGLSHWVAFFYPGAGRPWASHFPSLAVICFIYKMMGIETMISKVISRSDSLRNLVVRTELNERTKKTLHCVKPDDGSTLSCRWVLALFSRLVFRYMT